MDSLGYIFYKARQCDENAISGASPTDLLIKLPRTWSSALRLNNASHQVQRGVCRGRKKQGKNEDSEL